MENKFINFITFINRNLITKYNWLILVIWKLFYSRLHGLGGSKGDKNIITLWESKFSEMNWESNLIIINSYGNIIVSPKYKFLILVIDFLSVLSYRNWCCATYITLSYYYVKKCKTMNLWTVYLNGLSKFSIEYIDFVTESFICTPWSIKIVGYILFIRIIDFFHYDHN